jgi:hypothetical protein
MKAWTVVIGVAIVATSSALAPGSRSSRWLAHHGGTVPAKS